VTVLCDSAKLLPIDSNVTAWSGNCVGNVTLGTVCTATCSTNFTGPLNATCGADGNWVSSGQCTRLCTFDDLPDLYSTVANATTTSGGRRRLLVVDTIVWPPQCNTTLSGVKGSLPGGVCTVDCPNGQQGTGVTSVCGPDGIWVSTKNCTGLPLAPQGGGSLVEGFGF
jgi:hypothetical protein